MFYLIIVMFYFISIIDITVNELKTDKIKKEMPFSVTEQHYFKSYKF